MSDFKTASKQIDKNNLLVYVLAPYLKTTDENLKDYYDFTQSIKEFTRTFKLLNLPWKWQPATNENFKEVISHIEKDSLPYTPIVFNLCDGDEINNIPGISIIRELEKNDLIYTGADAFFYEVTTSKIPMKKLFEQHDIPTPKWKIISGTKSDANYFLSGMKLPVIVKPAVSGGSMGVGIKSVVHTAQALQAQVKILNEGYHGWNLTAGGIIIEEFIEGPEYTVLIVGSSQDPSNCNVYPPVERVFNKSLPEEEKFLSFDRLWEMYENENSMEHGEDFYNYYAPPKIFIDQLSKICLDAFCAVKGEGYARIDVRMDRQTGKMYVLEVNAQCGLSEDENYTSIGAILRLSGNTFSELIKDILERTIKQHESKVAV